MKEYRNVNLGAYAIFELWELAECFATSLERIMKYFRQPVNAAQPLSVFVS